MYLAIQKIPIKLESGDCVEAPLTFPMQTEGEVKRWLLQRGLSRDAKIVSLSAFKSWGGIEPGKN